ncbi:hypothetical protein [Planomonospora sp. ID82291]|uniref:hypothetical protein n=1 Tax=Planomonospora sp. ID82291 TaxID=2738136 RepID=UPI0018C35648|nr:hypothetical protein [Planomonospora sp. ID82291]MBG0818300.1 hypothetical protein [Planomonospora sp. ID82291]
MPTPQPAADAAASRTAAQPLPGWDQESPVVRGVYATDVPVYRVVCDECETYVGPVTLDMDEHVRDVRAHERVHDAWADWRAYMSVETLRAHRAAQQADRGRYDHLRPRPL